MVWIPMADPEKFCSNVFAPFGAYSYNGRLGATETTSKGRSRAPPERCSLREARKFAPPKLAEPAGTHEVSSLLSSFFTVCFHFAPLFDQTLTNTFHTKYRRRTANIRSSSKVEMDCSNFGTEWRQDHCSLVIQTLVNSSLSARIRRLSKTARRSSRHKGSSKN